MSYFNTKLLEKSLSADEFKLHLPDPKTFVNNIIVNNDIDTYSKIASDLKRTINLLKINVYQNEKYDKWMSNKIFKHFSIDIIYYYMMKYNNNTLSGYLNKKLVKYKDKFTNEQQSYIRSIILMYDVYSNVYSDVPITKNNSIEVHKYQDKYDNIEILLDLTTYDVKYKTEYIVWIIEMSALLQLCSSFDFYFDKPDEFFSKHVFWHSTNEDDVNITKEIIPLFKSKICYPVKFISHNQKKCILCTNIIL